MDASENNTSLPDLVVGALKSWGVPRPAVNVSRDFWMPDHSCRVCYDCDSQFTLFNRRHHCRFCGRVFCAKCTPNWVPVTSSIDSSIVKEESGDKIRVCNYCFKQWQQQQQGGLADHDDLISTTSLSPSAASFISTKSSGTADSTSCATFTSVPSCLNSSDSGSSVMESNLDNNEFAYLRRHSRDDNAFYDALEDVGSDYGSRKVHPDGEPVSSLSLQNSFEKKEDENDVSDEGEASSSMYAPQEMVEAEPLDFENNAQLWSPPEPEDEEDEREGLIYYDDDDEDDGNGDGVGEWGYTRNASNLGSGEFRNRERSNEEHKKAMKTVVDGHFRALVSQLLQVENLDDTDNWLEIITSLSWEAASLLKPDTSKGGGMDPGGYVKIKCLASGRPSDSMVVKGVVCKKNVAHRRMTSRIEKPRILILGGALEYQRVSNLLSSFDTLLQQEMDHLKMAVAKIDAHQPDVLLVEKSVSRYAQEYLLAKDISLVLNIKRPLLERIARCTGAQIAPSVDHLSSQTLGYCDTFHVEKFLEEHGTAGQGGKKLVKTLMYFDGCPKPLGCTILLRGANGDELKKVKHVIQYGVFAAYHLALETSFLADEGASLPDLPLNSPLTVALPDKASTIDRSISTIPGFTLPLNQNGTEPPPRSGSVPMSEVFSSIMNQKSDAMLPAGSMLSNMVVPGATGGGSPIDAPAGTKVSSESVDVTANNGFEHPQALGGLVTNSEIGYEMENVDQDGLDGNNAKEEYGSLKEEFPPTPSDNQSILVSLSSRCVSKGTVCERSHLFRIKYYGNFDKPLGRFLRDNLFDQNYRCPSCEMPSEAHVQCYTHREGTLTISVKKLTDALPGENDGKIWMWHRCLKCPRVDGSPPAIRRIVMSDAAWGLSFGKFLELSFSNHAAASRVANCGHTLHRDCLRFYGFGKMVACFRYASINVHSVYLPPSKLVFNYENQEWIQNEVNEVVGRAELLFSEILNALTQMAEKKFGKTSGNGSANMPPSRRQLAELEEMLQKEKAEFEESLQKVLNQEGKKDQPMIDILEINRLRRQLLFQSFVWDHRLVHAASVNTNSPRDDINDMILENMVRPNETLVNVKSPVDSDASENVDMKQFQPQVTDKEGEVVVDSSAKEENEIDISDPPKDNVGGGVHRALSEGQISAMASLSDTLDAAWTGNQMDTPSVMSDSDKGHHADDQLLTTSSLPSPTLSTKGSENITEDSTSWFSMPFLNFYRALNKNFLATSQKLDTLNDYKPVYISTYRESELQGGARLLLAVGVNDTVIPVYDDEPTSIISYALLTPDYMSQMSGDSEKLKDGGDSIFSSQSADSAMFQSLSSFDEALLESVKSAGEDSLLSMSGSRGSLVLDPLVYTKALHARVEFADDGPLGKVRYSVTCYYAKRFEALRRICCPSELDYIRSLSRCKKWGAQGGKSNVFFAKTLDDRFIIKQVTKTELESFIKFAPAYFKYLSESIGTGSPTCLAKILGIYQVTRQMKGGKETKMDVLVMENLLFGRNLTRLYDLKGSARSRYNADVNGSNKVLLDQNLIEAMPTSPIFVGNKAKRLLERAVWNDTAFLATIDVMDYSLLVGVDEEKHELVLGIIDFMRQYTWDNILLAQEQDERTTEDKKISEDNLVGKFLASRKQDKLRSNTLVRKPPGGTGVTGNKLKHLKSVQLPKAGGYTGNGFPIASSNRADKDKDIGTNNESSDTAVPKSENFNGKSDDRSRIEMLEEELRETAALEAGLYSIVAEHGSSTNKVHAPARRLSRFYLHACKEKDQEKRVNAARAITSGLVLVSKSCGNDVPRLTFWLSNSVMLRAIIYQTLGESSLHNARSNGKHKHSWKKVPDDWKDPQTFIIALEKVEAWMFSRIIESVWWQTLTPHMQSTATNANGKTVGQSQTSKKTSGSKNGLGNQQGNFSMDLWKKAFKDACERLCPTRAGGHECGCLPVLPRLVMEQLVGRLDVAMFNAILRESAEDMPTDPLSDPIADLRVLPIPAGKSSFGAGAQLKNTIGTWSRWLTDLFGIEDNDTNEDTDDVIDDTSFKAFRLLHSLSDLMMLPFEMLADKSTRKEVCPTLSTPLIRRVVCSFVPDEFSPNPIPNSLIEALDAEMQDDDIEAYEGSLINFPCTAPPSAYKPPPSSSFSAIIVGAQSLRRSSSSVLKKSYTSDDELDELDSPLTSILADSSRVSSSSDGLQWFPKGGRSIVRYQLLREVWKDSE